MGSDQNDKTLTREGAMRKIKRAGSQKNQTPRRGLLGNIALALLSVIGLSASVSGHSTPADPMSRGDKMVRQKAVSAYHDYDSLPMISEALATVGKPLLEKLEQEGFLPDSSVGILPLSEIISPADHAYGAEDGVTLAGVITPRGPTARIQFVKKTTGFTNVITIEPHTDYAYAIVRSSTSDVEYFVYPNRIVDPATGSTVEVTH